MFLLRFDDLRESAARAAEHEGGERHRAYEEALVPHVDAADMRIEKRRCFTNSFRARQA